jgi:hypothetical protein
MPYSDNKPRSFNNYNSYQEECWQAFDHAFHAYTYNYPHLCHPSPSFVYKEEDYRAWKDKFHAAWQKEADGRGKAYGQVGLQDGQYTENLYLYLYEAFLLAAEHKQEVFTYA